MKLPKEIIEANKDEGTAVNILIYGPSDLPEVERHHQAQADFNKLCHLVDDGSDESKSLVRMHNNRAMLAYEEIQRKTDKKLRDREGTKATQHNANIRYSIYIGMAELAKKSRPSTTKEEVRELIQKKIKNLIATNPPNVAALFERIRVDIGLPDDLDYERIFKTGTGDRTINEAIKNLFE